MSKLLSRAEACLEAGITLWQKRHLDDAYVDMCCMNIGYSIEFCLKYLLESEGIVYKEDHNIYGLLCSLPDSYSTSEWYLILSPISRQLSEWATKSRYSDSFTTTQKMIVDVQRSLPLLINDCKSGVTYVSTLESRVSKILTQLKCKYPVNKVIPYLPEVELDDSSLFSAVKFAIELISKL